MWGVDGGINERWGFRFRSLTGRKQVKRGGSVLTRAKGVIHVASYVTVVVAQYTAAAQHHQFQGQEGVGDFGFIRGVRVSSRSTTGEAMD